MSRFLSLRIGHGGHEQVIPDRGARDAVAAWIWRNSQSTGGSQQCRHHSESEANVVRFPPGFGNIHYEHHFGNSWLVIYALCQVMLKKQNSTSALNSWYFTRKVFIHHTFTIVSISCWLYPHIIPALWDPVLSCLSRLKRRRWHEDFFGPPRMDVSEAVLHLGTLDPVDPRYPLVIGVFPQGDGFDPSYVSMTLESAT